MQNDKRVDLCIDDLYQNKLESLIVAERQLGHSRPTISSVIQNAIDLYYDYLVTGSRKRETALEEMVGQFAESTALMLNNILFNVKFNREALKVLLKQFQLSESEDLKELQSVIDEQTVLEQVIEAKLLASNE